MSLGQCKFYKMNYKNTSFSEDSAFRNCTQKTAVLRETFPDSSAGRVCLQCRRRGRFGFDPWVGMILWGRKWQPAPEFLPVESHGQRSLAGYSPWGRRESDTTEILTSHIWSGWPQTVHFQRLPGDNDALDPWTAVFEPQIHWNEIPWFENLAVELFFGSPGHVTM